MNNDTYYHEKLFSWRGSYARSKARAIVPQNLHCQWHDGAAYAVAAARRHGQRGATWASCSCPAALKTDFDPDGEADDDTSFRRVPDRWLPGCATPQS